NPVYTIAELSRQINDSNPKMVVTVPELWNKVKGFNFDLPAVIIGSSNIAGLNSKFTSFETLMEASGITIFL
ncbi:4-coumarate-CoA ligase-like 7-like, partial [Trifolium medium]|nr:4-coumarate-CoA ligase-like 7-like [Trifolium medium]